MGTSSGTKSSCFPSYLLSWELMCREGGTQARQSGDLGSTPIWDPITLYNLDLGGGPHGSEEELPMEITKALQL